MTKIYPDNLPINGKWSRFFNTQRINVVQQFRNSGNGNIQYETLPLYSNDKKKSQADEGDNGEIWF